MSFKSAIKTKLFGPVGDRPRQIKRGLLKGRTFNVDTASKTMRLLGLDETEIAGVTRTLAAKATYAFDIGAHDGWYTLFFASQPGMKKVWAIDGSAERLELLKANLSLNGADYQKKVEPVAKLVGSKDDAEFVTVDSFFDRIDAPVLLKIDVDGAEMDVFRGAERVLRDKKASVILETHTADLEKECVTFLANLGYTCAIIPNGWYRSIVPEMRPLAHNRWLTAVRA